MRIVVQRSLKSSVHVADEKVGEIEHGLVLLVCFEKGDSRDLIKKAGDKILNLRVFENPETDKMDFNIAQTKGQILAISQFTLSWKGQKGNRPGFESSMAPNDARVYFRLFCDYLAEKVTVATGRFGAKMDVNIHNHGPVTFFLEF